MNNRDSVNEIVAAGGVVRAEGRLVLLVHRPKYNDWSFPKGKTEPNETIDEAAIREVREETGLTCRITRELQPVRYHVNRKGAVGPKVVYYFLMEPSSGNLKVNNYEIDRAEWFNPDDAMRVLTYDHDRQLLDSLIASDFK